MYKKDVVDVVIERIDISTATLRLKESGKTVELNPTAPAIPDDIKAMRDAYGGTLAARTTKRWKTIKDKGSIVHRARFALDRIIRSRLFRRRNRHTTAGKAKAKAAEKKQTRVSSSDP